MPSTFFGLTIGSSGLNAAQVAINTTAHNISNIETKGYSRQKVNQQAGEALRVYSSYGMVGSGVAVNGIDQIRDFYYDKKYWYNNGVVGEYTAKNYYMDQIEDLYFSDITSIGFTTYYSDWCNALNSLSATPALAGTRNQAIQAAQSFAEYYNQIAGSLNTLQDECNIQIKIITERVNTIAKGLAALNKQINVLEMNGGTANDLRDQRNNLVDELSTLVGVTVEEYESPTGSGQYKIKINNQVLVNGYDYNELVVTARTANESRHLEDVVGLYDISWSNGTSFDIYNPSLTGALRGYIDIRDGDNLEKPDYPARAQGIDYKGTPYYKEETNEFVSTYVREFNMLHMQGVNLDNESTIYTPFFSMTNMTTEKILEQSQKLVRIYQELSGTTGENEDKLLAVYETVTGNAIADVDVDDPDALAKALELASKELTTWAYNNLGYSPAVDGDVASYITNWVEDKACAYAIENTPGLTKDAITDADLKKHIKSYLYRTDSDGNFLDADGNVVTDEKDAAMNFMPMVDYISENITAATMCVNPDIVNDNNKMATATEIDNGVDNADIVTRMAELRDKKFFQAGTAAEFMQGLVASSSIDASAAKNMETNHNNIAKTILNQRLSVSGVDKEEEAVDLIKYQQAYELAAKVISVMSELYDTLINRTGV